MPKKLILLICSLFTVILVFEIGARFYLPADFNSAYDQVISPTELGSEENNDLYEVNRHLTFLNRQPKTPHPYFGYVYNRFLDPRINREGFLDPHVYPYKKAPNEYVIGIFGGSLAKNFGLYQIIKSTHAKPTLGNQLKAKAPLFFKDKKIVILNFGMSSYKQPQQFIAASFFLNSIDMAINIDGYNELDESTSPEFPIYFPAHSKMFFSRDPQRQRYWLNLLTLRQKQLALTRWIADRPFFSSSGLMFILWKAASNRLDTRIKRAQAETNAVDSNLPYYESQPSFEEATQEKVAIWEKFTRLEHVVLKSEKVLSFFFIQPNQYIPQSKPFSEIEQKEFLKPNDSTARLVLGYQSLLKQAVPKLQAEGVPVFDLTQIFKNHPETLYSDSCCHVNFDGNLIMENSIADKIAAHLMRGY